jgi:GAF domain-containing protein
MINCVQCRNVFRVIGDALNLKLDTPVMLEMAAQALVDQFDLKAVHFRLLGRDQRNLEDVASYGLSQRFLDKGPVDAERSISEAMQGHVVAIKDCATDPRIQYPRECAEEGLKSVLTVPLETRGQVIGVMRVFTGERREFRSDEVELFKVAAVFCSSAIIDCMFHKILRHVTESIRSTLELPEVLDTIVTVVSEDLRAKGCAIHLVDDATSKLEIRAANGLARAFVESLVDAFSSDVAHEVLTGRSVAIYDARSDDQVEAQDLMRAEGVASILLTPLLRRQNVIGVMSLFTFRPYVFSAEEKQLMEAIGEQCSLAIDNAKMFAALKRRYDSLVDDFNLWFEHTQGVPDRDMDG